MKNILRSGIAKKAILLAFIAGIVSPSAFAYYTSTNTGANTLTASQYTPVNSAPVTTPTANPYTLTATQYTPVSETPVLVANNTPIVSNVSLAEATSKAVAAINPVISNLTLSPSSYNPANGSATITFSLNTGANTTVWIVDTNDNIVKQIILDQPLTTGSQTFTWNGRDEQGSTVSATNYRVKAHAYNSASSTVSYYNFSVTGTNQNNAPSLSISVGSGSFNPDQGQSATISYTLSGSPAEVRVLVKDNNGNTVRTLKSLATTQPGTYQLNWDGRNDSGNIVPAGSYTIEVYATNANGSDTENGSTTVVRNNNNTCDIITSHYAVKSSFNPENEVNYIRYTLSRDADVTVRIKDGSTVLRTLQSGNQVAGNKEVVWNGRNSSSNYVSDRTYTYEIAAYVGSCATDTETGSIRVNRDGSDDDDYESDWPSTDEDLIKNIRVIRDIFDPTEGERSTIEFELTDDADLKVEVLDGTTIIKTLRDVNNQSEGDYSYTWDGRDSDGDIVRDRVYQYRVMADNGDDTDTDRAWVEVDTDGIIIGFPTEARCAGFKDVSIYSPFCKAIELMSKRNIFDGYSDGTFRPNVAINRAETTKVVTLALDYDVPTGSYFGKQFRDTNGNAWYAPYLEVALRNGIIDGYPDGSFRPSNTINRVELLKIFLNAHKLDMPTCNEAPFLDTPITRDTAWYMPFACFAKENGLMNGEYSRYLYPAKAMTRGDVADLFYDFEMMGYYRNNNNNNNRYNYCEYDRYGNVISGSCDDNYYDNDYSYNYNYDNNYSYNTTDGYYVYRDGRYEWVRY